MRAIDLGARVVLIERDRIGGAGLYDGALSSKALWEFSNKFAIIKKEMKDKGIDYDVTFQEAMKPVRDVVFERKSQLTIHTNLLQKVTRNKLFTHERGFASLKSKNEVLIKKDGTDKLIWAENIILATGSRPRHLPNLPADEKIILTSDGIEHLDDFPESLVIVGAGVIGCEYATIFSNFGKTKVYLIDKADRILPFEDEDLAKVVATNLESNGVTIHRNSSLERLEIKDGKVEYELKYKDGRREVMRVEKALLSIGRVPNTENLGLKEVGVEMDERGCICTNDTQTKVPNIYAVGDITPGIALVNVGEREGRHAAAKICKVKDLKPLVYSNISTIMFLNPEVAAVGLNEQDCMARKINTRVAKVDYSCIARAIAMRRTNGFMKLIVTDDDEMRVLGMRAVGEQASSTIQAVALLIYMNMGIREIGAMMYPHPSITEGVQECARLLLGRPLFKSSVFKDKLKAYRCRDGVCTPMENL
jgi:dihydrolipoamide dehydrogenase